MTTEWTNQVVAITSIINTVLTFLISLATTLAAYSAWKAFKVYEQMHSSQENEIQRNLPNLNILVSFKEINHEMISAEYYFQLVNTTSHPIIITGLSPSTELIRRNLAIRKNNTRVEFPIRIEKDLELILYDNGTLPNLEKVTFFDATDKKWPVTIPAGLLKLQEKLTKQI